jgi:hypothetical protein
MTWPATVAGLIGFKVVAELDSEDAKYRCPSGSISKEMSFRDIIEFTVHSRLLACFNKRK